MQTERHGDATLPNSAQAAPSTIRLWPLWIILGLQALAMALTILPSINNATRFYFMMGGPLVCLGLFLIWILFLSRLRWAERLLVPVLIVVLGVLTGLLADASVRVAVWIYGIPFAMFAVGLALTATRQQPRSRRLPACLIAVLIAFAVFPLVRVQGFTGSYLPELAWRWTASTEGGLASAAVDPEAQAEWEPSSAAWPGFRGPTGDSRITGFTLSQDWESAPPIERWRISVGPAWSSFAHVSGRLFTQEQRQDQEIIACYEADTGEQIWAHQHPARFSELVSGPGPRATPTFADGRILACGAMGLFVALNAADGEVLWEHDLVAELNAPVPMWGFSCSPLVLDGVAIVYAGGADDNGLIAYNVESGDPVWAIASAGLNFSSAQRVTFDGQDYALFGDSSGLWAIEPASGKVAWRYTPTQWRGPAIVQPQQIGPNSIITPLGDGTGVARIEVTRDGEDWEVEERWSSRALKPSFNDFVYHDGYLYGFDQSIFVCANADTGKREWKDGRYGFGQVLLLPETAQLVVLSEKGELILLAADPSEHREMARIPVLTGKTWNHPILAEEHLFVRNGNEAVSFALSAAEGEALR